MSFQIVQTGTREIAKLAGLKSNATVAAYWKRWSKLGIVEESAQYKGRYIRICSLEEVRLTLPPTLQRETKEDQQSPGDASDER